MKNIIYILIAGFLSTSFISAQSNECLKKYREYEILYKKQDYKGNYPIWKQLMQECPDVIVNIYNHAPVFLPALIAESEGTEKQQYIDDLINSYDQRFKYYKENKDFLEGEKLYFELTYGKKDSLTVHKELKEVFAKAKKNNDKVSINAIHAYFYNAYYLNAAGKINTEDYIEAYNDSKSAIANNIDVFQQELGPLALKKEGIKKLNSDEDSIKPSNLDFRESQLYSISKANIESNNSYDTLIEDALNSYLTCDNVNYFVTQDFDSKKNDSAWVVKNYYLLQQRECTDGENYAKIKKRVFELYPPSTVLVGGGKTGSTSPNSSFDNNYENGLDQFRASKYSAAIGYFQKVIDQSSNNSIRSNAATYMGYSYVFLGQYSAARNAAYKAINYNSGNGEAYLVIANAYYKGAGQVPGTALEKKYAFWAAADQAYKAARIDGRVRAKANRFASQVDAAAPNKTQCFQAGISAGSSVKVGGWINTTTTARCK